jgi:hypothetical protein
MLSASRLYSADDGVNNERGAVDRMKTRIDIQARTYLYLIYLG